METSFQEQLALVRAYLATVTPPGPIENAPPRPKFEPEKWRNTSLNCFAYAANDRAAFGDCPVPGKLANHPSPRTPCRVFNDCVADGFIPAPLQEKDAIPPDIDGYYKVSLSLAPERPSFFHFYKKDGKTWSEMSGYGTPSNRDDFGKAIRDPRKARYFETSGPKYEHVAFFYVRCPGIRLTKARNDPGGYFPR